MIIFCFRSHKRAHDQHFSKGIGSLPQSLIFQFLYLCDPISYFNHQTFYFFVLRLFPEVVQLRCHSTGMFLIQTRERGHLGCSIHKNSCLKLSKYTFDMIQNTLEDNNMDKTIVYKWTKRKKCNGE